jgi:dTDP-4-dehydrorhamnose reductase
MRILVTGAGGMLGHDLLDAASAAGVECLGLAHAELDIADAAEVAAAVQKVAPDVVVNCAAWTNVDGAESEFDAARAINGDGAGNVAAAARSAGVWTIHVSSDYVFEGNKRTPYVESDPTGPLSGYGRSKLAGEEAVGREAPNAHTIVRSSWLFGAHGHCFPATIMRLAGERDELTVVDDQVGCPTFTGHLAQALLTLCRTRPLGILHVAGGGSCSWYELAKQVVADTGRPTQVIPGKTSDHPRPAPRPANSVLATEREADAPSLPHWREGLAGYMAARGVRDTGTVEAGR